MGVALERELAALEAARKASAQSKPEPSELLGKLCALVLEAEAPNPGLLGPYGSTWREAHNTRVESAGADTGSRHGDSVVKARNQALRRQIRAGRRRRARATTSVASLGSLTASLANKRGNEILSELLCREPPSPHTSHPPSRTTETHRVELLGASPQPDKGHAASAGALPKTAVGAAEVARKNTQLFVEVPDPADAAAGLR